MSESSKTKTALMWFHWTVRAGLLFFFVTGVLLFFVDDTWREVSVRVWLMIGPLICGYALAVNAITHLEAEITALKAKLGKTTDDPADE